MTDTINREDAIRAANDALFDWFKTHSQNLTVREVGIIMMGMGSNAMYQLAPSKEVANEVIQEGIERGWKNYLENEQKKGHREL